MQLRGQRIGQVLLEHGQLLTERIDLGVLRAGRLRTLRQQGLLEHRYRLDQFLAQRTRGIGHVTAQHAFELLDPGRLGLQLLHQLHMVVRMVCTQRVHAWTQQQRQQQHAMEATQRQQPPQGK